MAEMWKPQTPEVYKSWVDTIIDEASNNLSSWETSFVDSLKGLLANGRFLSEKQAQILERIYSEKTK